MEDGISKCFINILSCFYRVFFCFKVDYLLTIVFFPLTILNIRDECGSFMKRKCMHDAHFHEKADLLLNMDKKSICSTCKYVKTL